MTVFLSIYQSTARSGFFLDTLNYYVSSFLNLSPNITTVTKTYKKKSLPENKNFANYTPGSMSLKKLS